MLGTLALLLGCQADETVRAYGGADRVWILKELNGAPFPATATLTFPPNGGIAGNAPCNRYSAPMTAPYPWFDAGPIVATKKACPDLSSEQQFLEALQAVALSEVAGRTLILSNTEGLSLIFAATD